MKMYQLLVVYIVWKVGEGDNVFIYDYPEFPYEFKGMNDEEKQQEKNLLYVAITRAKKNLYLVGISEESEEAIKVNMESELKVNLLLKDIKNSSDN